MYKAQLTHPVLSGDHSEVVPLLPIPNRTVKRLSADDSADCPCESRTLPDSQCQKAQLEIAGLFALWTKSVVLGMTVEFNRIKSVG